RTECHEVPRRKRECPRVSACLRSAANAGLGRRKSTGQNQGRGALFAHEAVPAAISQNVSARSESTNTAFGALGEFCPFQESAHMRMTNHANQRGHSNTLRPPSGRPRL